MEKRMTLSSRSIRMSFNTYLTRLKPPRGEEQPSSSLFQGSLRKFRSIIMGDSVYSFLNSQDSSDYGSLRNSFDIELPASEASKAEQETSFSWAEYCSFFVIGMSMMWTWSMILQAVPYFQRRFKSNEWILRYFQSLNLVVFAFAILAGTLVLAKSRAGASYGKRLRSSLGIYITVAVLLTISTIGPLAVEAEIYFIFLMSMVAITAFANALSQNAAFAFAAGFGRTEYAPAIMTGEALAGLLPSVVEIFSALLFPSSYFDSNESDRHHTSLTTFFYFFVGIIFGLGSLCSLKFLEYRRRNRSRYSEWATPSSDHDLLTLWKKLYWPASANFLCLCISAVSPVFASKILSLNTGDDAPILLRPGAFIPLAIVLRNIGDLLGSMLAVFFEGLTRRPFLLFFLSLARISFIPLYLICNIDGKGSVAGDWFYLILVQLLFGLTHGCISGISMSGVPNWVEIEDREAAGAFMGMSVVVGLVAGSGLGLLAAQA